MDAPEGRGETIKDSEHDELSESSPVVLDEAVVPSDRVSPTFSNIDVQ